MKKPSASRLSKEPGPELIVWEDSQSPNHVGWLATDEIDTRVSVMRSVGYLIKERKGSVTIAAHYHDDCVQGVITIPKSAILKRKVLK